jgi:hypothetical protein
VSSPSTGSDGVENNPIDHLADPRLNSVNEDTSMLVDYIVQACWPGSPMVSPPHAHQAFDLFQIAVRGTV